MNQIPLEKRIYEALESIVGPENISQDLAVLAGYSYYGNAFLSIPEKPPEKWTPFPDAVILPGSAEEVQAIVKTCNRYGVKFKAHSTGWGSWAAVMQKNSVLMDLRRMDRILEIDEKNVYALIEPYVTAMQLRAEAMKKGLICNVVGAGPNHSVLASATSMQGMGATNYTTAHNSRNLLGVEWVTPTGEIVRVGTAGSGAGWFCGDGPGPSLRGLFRGYAGAMGGLGVFTKCAVKLYSWPGPPELEVKGEIPAYGYEIPKNIKLYIADFPDWKSLNDAAYKIGDAKIGYVVWRTTSPESMAILMAPQMGVEIDEIYETMKTIFPRHRLEITLAGHSMRELEYEEMVLKDIVEGTNGKLKKVEEDPVLGPMKESLFSSLVFQDYNAGIFSATGNYGTSFGSEVCPDRAIKCIPVGIEIRRKYVKQGHFVNDGPENFWGGPEEQNRYCHWEGLFMYDPADAKSLKSAAEHATREVEAGIKNKLGVPIASNTYELVEILGPHHSNYHVWLKKIKKTFDPDNLSDHSFYVKPE